MYLEHFGYDRKPFDLRPDPEFFYASGAHRLGYSVLEYGLRHDCPLSVLTGDVGSGKSTLVERLIHQAGPEFEVGVVRNTHAAFGDVVNWVADAFDCAGNADTSYRQVIRHLEGVVAQGRKPVLIIDEAQNLSLDNLEAIRLLTNLRIGPCGSLQVMLVGQPELHGLLRRPELRQLLQRVSADFNLRRLDQEQVADYVRHRESVAGRETSAFADEAVSRIAQHSRGIPRVVNTLCDLGLVYAFADELASVTDEVMLEVIREKYLGGLFVGDDQAEQIPVVREAVPYDQSA